VCRSREEQWARSLEDIPPDIALVLTGTWEVADRRLPGEATWRHLGDPAYDEFLRGELLRAVDLLSSRGALVVWLTYPGSERSRQSRSDVASERTERLNALIAELPAARPGRVRVIDFRALVESLPDIVAGAPARPDGVHLTHAAAYQVVREGLGPRLLELYRSASAPREHTDTPSDR
jgi:lysophospholipase L1-like esterase